MPLEQMFDVAIVAGPCEPVAYRHRRHRARYITGRERCSSHWNRRSPRRSYSVSGARVYSPFLRDNPGRKSRLENSDWLGAVRRARAHSPLCDHHVGAPPPPLIKQMMGSGYRPRPCSKQVKGPSKAICCPLRELRGGGVLSSTPSIAGSFRHRNIRDENLSTSTPLQSG